MLYVVIRQIDGIRTTANVSPLLETAQSFYEEAAFVCDNDPGEGPEDNPTIVSNCWLYEADTLDPNLAKAMAYDGRATLLASYD